MIQIKPILSEQNECRCGGYYTSSGLLWQGLHICRNLICNKCGITKIDSLPINQASLELYSFFPESGILTNEKGETVKENWYSSKLKSISSPLNDEVELDIEIREKCDDVILLNTLDYVYGHSLLYLFNLQRLIEERKSTGIVVLVQPMLRWLIPDEGIAEIWTVKMDFQSFNNYYPDLSEKINFQLNRFRRVFLSKGHIIPTNRNIQIEDFTAIKPFSFSDKPLVPRITFIWREDTDRLWIRNIYLSKGLKKLGIGKILLPFQYLRVLFLFYMLREIFGNSYRFTVAGLGNYGRWPGYIDDQRVLSFDVESEKKLCRLYADSILTIGLHGSSMLLPSAHAGMSVSLMPSKRWGNYLEDILFNEDDLRLAFFQKRILPINMSLFDLRDILYEMITGREYFIKKFVHSDEL